MELSPITSSLAEGNPKNMVKTSGRKRNSRDPSATTVPAPRRSRRVARRKSDDNDTFCDDMAVSVKEETKGPMEKCLDVVLIGGPQTTSSVTRPSPSDIPFVIKSSKDLETLSEGDVSGSQIDWEDDSAGDCQSSTTGIADQSGYINEASDSDSDSDDKRLPEDFDLEESQPRITKTEQEMDDNADNLLGINAKFKWDSNFNTFKSVRELFTGPTPGPVKDYNTPYEAFIDIWDESMMEHIVVETNRYASQTIDAEKANDTWKPKCRLRKWKDTCVQELHVLFGVFILMGIDARATIKEYWTSDKYLEMPGFKKIMTYARYILLNKCLYFVDSETLVPDPLRDQKGDDICDIKLEKLQPILTYLNRKFKELYNLRPEISVDESLLLKTAGMKSFELCEAVTGYLFNFIIYTGKATNSDDSEAVHKDLDSKTTRTVLKLMEGLWNRGHCLTMDNFYNSPALARYLKSMKTDCLGTLKASRRHVPSAIWEIEENVRKGTMVARHCEDVGIFAWKDTTKLVTLISTYHTDETGQQRSGAPFVKPAVVCDYNRNWRSGVDIKDQKLSMFRVERSKSTKWYINMFKRFFSASVHNAWIMYSESRRRRNLPSISHRSFRMELAHALIDQVPQKQATSGPRPHESIRTDRMIIHKPGRKPKGEYSQGRCVLCYRLGRDKRIMTRCETCSVYICYATCWEPYHTLEKLPESPRKRKWLRKHT